MVSEYEFPDFSTMKKLQFVCYKDLCYTVSNKGKLELGLPKDIDFNGNKNGLWDLQCQELDLFQNVIL